MADDKKEVRFGEAMEELESILERIDSEDVDIDQLASELKRAAELLDVCRTRIRAADLEVTAIVQKLESSESEEEGAGDDGSDE